MIIYKATNTINGMSYIGQTIFTIDKRRLKHERLDDKSYFQLAIDRYGKDNFDWEVLCECSSPEEMSEMEMKYIDECSTLRPNGYNLTKGGEGSFWTGENNPSKLEHIREKISRKAKGRKRPDLVERNKGNVGKTYEDIYGEDRAREIRSIQSKRRMGKPGVKWSDEMKQRSVESKSIYEYTLTNPDGIEYTEVSLRQLCIKYKLNRQSMQRIMNTGNNVKGWTINRELI